ncbi:MAG: helix-turn-helix domain-containing protein [Methylomicrobium sp.]|nr:helix-turn-helix domain-containing protein [Methylomicrobium sp.]
MQTLNVYEAAEFLRMNPEVLRRKARSGLVPGRRTGRGWLFIKEHLADWVSGRYPEPGRELRVIDGKKTSEGKQSCRSTNAAKRGGYSTPIQTADEYYSLLKLK